MNGPFGQSFNYAATEEFTQQFASYDNQLNSHDARFSGPPTPFSGQGFWYRPEPRDDFFGHHSTHPNHSQPAPEQSIPVKHRRTRSGCFTCRSRRVKCDETRPICDRCRKGNRECMYPQTSGSKRIRDSSSIDHGTAVPRDEQRQGNLPLEPIVDGSEDEGATPPPSTTNRTGIGRSDVSGMSRKQKFRRESAAVAAHQGRSPPTSEAESLASPTQLSPSGPANARWSSLRQAEQDLLEFQQHHVTEYHYFLRHDYDDFIHTKLIDLALGFEPLLSAVLAFTAYHREFQSPDGELQEFWKYYCRSIVQLRKWLEVKHERGDAVLLTILQLAMFEEYLGDWPNLVVHHRAAHTILLSLYSADTIVSTQTSRIIFDWFGRIDIIASLMAGADTVLERQWFVTILDWCRGQYDPENVDIQSAFEYFHANIRLIGYDMASAFARAPHITDFAATAAAISNDLDSVRLEMQALHDTADTMPEVERIDSKERDKSPRAFDPNVPLFAGDLWQLNFVWLDWYSGQQMHLYQTAKILHDQAELRLNSPSETTGVEVTSGGSGLSNMVAGMDQTWSLANTKELPARLTQLAILQCQIYEAVEHLPSAPPGAVLGCHIGMAFCTVFLKREPRFTDWARKKLANIERQGYIWPAIFRASLAQHWNIPDLVEWWLPRSDGKPKIIDDIRAIINDRNREHVLAAGSDDWGHHQTDLRELKAIFDNMDLGIPTRIKDDAAAVITGGTENNQLGSDGR